MIFSTQLGIVAMGIIFAVGGILYAINYDFTSFFSPAIQLLDYITEPIYNAIGCYTHTNATWVGVCK